MKETELFSKNNMYVLRGVSMLLIILHHINHHADIAFGIALLGRLLDELGYLSTGVFFLLSGYGLTVSINKNQPITLSYCTKRLFRIFYTFLYAYVFCLVGLWILGADVTLLDILMDISTLSMPFSPTWFLKTIFCVYVVYFMISYYVKQPEKQLMILFGIFAVYYIIAYNTLPYYYYVSFFNFLLGSLMVYGYSYISNKRNVILFLATICFVIFFYLRLTTLCSLTFSCLSVLAFSVYSFNNRFLQYVGIHSLIFYLGQFLPLTMDQYIKLGTVPYFIATYVITFVVAISFGYVMKLCKKA